MGKHLGCLNLGAIIHNAATNMLEYMCMCISVGSGMVGSKVVLDCVKQISKVVVLIDTHFFQPGMKVPIAPHPHLHLA